MESQSCVVSGKYYKDKLLRGIFVGMMANSIMLACWLPLPFTLEPGEPYVNMGGLFISFFVIPPTLIYAIVLACTRTKCLGLKVTAVVLNFTPILIMISVLKLLAVTGHIPGK